MNIKDFAEKYIKAITAAFQKNGFSLLEEVEDVNVVYHTPALVGHEAHKQSIIDSYKYYSEIKQEWKYLTGEEHLFALSYKAHYVSTGVAPFFPPVGKEAGRDAIFLYRLENNKIVEVWQNGSWLNIDTSVLSKMRQQ